MSVLYIVLPLAFVLAGIAVWACTIAILRGQYDDLDTPPVRALHDDVRCEVESEPQKNEMQQSTLDSVES